MIALEYKSNFHVVVEGTPEEVAQLAENHTGRLLKPLLVVEPKH